jgi:mannosyltransferase OCH1-like enzyme
VRAPFRPAKNPQYRYEVLTDDNANEYLEWHYGAHGINRPDLVDLYRELNITIIKADLLRYLVMYAEGGVYADIDVECLRPISRFIPERYNEQDVDMIIGVEIDEPTFADHEILGSKCKSFCQWTFAAKPRLPVMMRLIENIQVWLHELSHEKEVEISQLHLDFDEVISGTGPSAFTKAVLEQMTAQNQGKPVTWDLFHNLAESRLVNGILVLNVEAFAAGQGHSDSGNHDSRGALVKHHYHASGWPTLHPRRNHPMYGEVEQCNWKPECVAEWVSQTATKL